MRAFNPSRPFIIHLLACFVAACPAAFSPALAQLGSVGPQVWQLGQAGIDGPLQANAQMGGALASGDFNCDGFDDLAIGVPGFDVKDVLTNAGALLVLYGSIDGPTATGSQFFDQLDPDLSGVPEVQDNFAASLAAGDFDGDGCAELAIGTPFENHFAGEDALNDAGEVTILLGDASGLLPGYTFSQGANHGGVIAGALEAGDRFGQALVAHDFDLDGLDDLAIGVPGEDVGGTSNAGAVAVLFGSATGVNGARDILLYRNVGVLSGMAQVGEQLGLALAAGQFSVATGHELAIGGPGKDLPGAAGAGGVVIVSNLAGALTTTNIDASIAGVPGSPQTGANFGAALAAGDFDADGWTELAIGAPRASQPGQPSDSGSVAVVDFGGPISNLLLTQGLISLDDPEAQDQFGEALAAGDFDGDGADDLAIGVPHEDFGPLADAGVIHTLEGTPGAGLGLGSGELRFQALNPSESNDNFGAALVTGHFSGHAGAGLAVGVPFEQIGAAAAAGVVNVIQSDALFNDGFESGDTSGWALTVE